MRRRVQLYIGGMKADIGDQSLILMNWTQEDASAPTAVVAPYSQQVTLQGTPANDRIFGVWRPDRVTAPGGETGAAFDPLRKTSFEIRNAQGEVMEAGYVRLDGITRKRSRYTYKVTLFGGIGSFFYGLTYNEDGSEMTLADLDYTPAGGPGELDFRITAQAVHDAWNDLGTGADPLWRVVNFAPAYEGIPDKDFDAAKGIVTPSLVGLSPTQPGGYTTKGTRALMNLPSAVDQWAAKDLRSYLQRPVLNFGAFIGGVVRKAASLGYTFDASALATLGDYACAPSQPVASDLWLTLRQLTASAPVDVSGASLVKTAAPVNVNPLAAWDVTGAVIPTGTKVTVSLSSGVVMGVGATVPAPRLWGSYGSPTRDNIFRYSVIFARFVGKAAGTEVCRSKIITLNLRDSELTAPAAYKLIAGSAPADDDFGEVVRFVDLDVIDATSVRLSARLDTVLEGYDIDRVELQIVRAGVIAKVNAQGKPSWSYGESQSTFLPAYFTGSWDAVQHQATSLESVAGSGADTVAFVVPSSLRSGALVTKRMLLGGTNTPAQYLLSYAKTLGLYFATDPATKTVTICTRGGYYDGGTIDLTRRVDATSVAFRPLAVDAKWYAFAQDVKGAFASEYEDTYGSAYGSKRVNTGYEFNDDTKDIISASVLRGAVTALEQSKYFNFIVDGADVFRPSVELDEGVTYTLWTADGKNLDTPVPIPGANEVTLTYYNTNPECQGYDIEFANKLQNHGADGKPVDGHDVLVFFEGRNTYEYMKVTDDDATMYAITGGKGCWDLDPGDPDGLSVPSFQRFLWMRGSFYHESAGLDFGAPRELALPRQTITDGDDRMVYGRGWRAYLQDRYARDTKVMTCKVNLAGLPVGQTLLRCFWWYGGALWTLNKISNYSVTTAHLTDCEFVQVQDKAAYVSGQNY